MVFFDGVVKRLQVLTDNSRRLAAGRALNPPLSGGDELALLDRAFRETAASLGEQKQENEMFVYSVSHDLRSPLINLQGFSEELRLASHELEKLFDRAELPPELKKEGKKLLSGNIAESVSYVHAAVDRLSGIIDALLRLSRAGRVQFQWQTVDVGAIVEKVVAALHDSINTKRATVTVESLPTAWGDPTAVEQIFANLLDNAVSYVDPARPGRIEVGSRAAGEWRGPAQPAGLLCQGQWAGHSHGLSSPGLHGVQPAASRCVAGRGDRAGPGAPDGRAPGRHDVAGV